MRLGLRSCLALVLLISLFMELQPLSAVAADCSKEQAAVDALVKELNALDKQLNNAYKKLDAASRDIASDLQTISDLQKSLSGQADRARQEADASGASKAASAALAVALPPGLSYVVSQYGQFLHRLGQRAHEAAAIYQNFRDLVATARALEELNSHTTDLSAARAKAVKGNLNELRDLIDQELAITKASRDLTKARDRWEAAFREIAALRALVKQKVEEWAAAQAALIACLKKPAPVPESSACPTPVSSGNTGGGHCR